MKRPKFTIAAVYDTETTNYCEDPKRPEKTKAFPILFIENDIRDVDLYNYEPEKNDKIHFYRYEQEFQDRIDQYVRWGKLCGEIPVICAYNLMFDLQPLMWGLNERYTIKANAQSSTNVYTLDLYEGEGTQVLRFWDTYHLEMRGLRAMGETAGLPKAIGDWDYKLIRAPQTVLTSEELFYAKRDVQVIPAFLRYLLRSNEWMRKSDLGFRVLTKTSLVRQTAKHEIARLTVPKRDGGRLELQNAFIALCRQELPKTYQIYCLRKACFRGGYTFTAAAFALTLQRWVLSADVTSMHHTFINGRYIPYGFTVLMPRDLRCYCDKILNTTREQIMERYHKPFDVAIHARLRFRNIRMRKGTCFDKWGIALEPASKFKGKVKTLSYIGKDDAQVMQDNEIFSGGWHDQFHKATFAFGKLYEAEEIIIHVSELELWCMSRVYEWDAYECIYGEGTEHFKLPPDYVTLQSNKLYKEKNACKRIVFSYKEGTPYDGSTELIPEGLAKQLKAGTLSAKFFESYYSSTVKGKFNGIYGTQAQDVFKPQYACEDGELFVDRETVTTERNFDAKKPKGCKVLYTYGMRIVGGSRMHMVLALELLYEALGDRIRVLGGDTDSMKISCDKDVTDEEVSVALEPIAQCSTKAIDVCMKRLRENFPDLASGLNGIGGFELENAGHRYPLHYEMWNKARVSWDGKHVHITCAGLPRPIDKYNIETFLEELINAGNDVGRVFTESLGFDTFVSNDVAHTIEHRKPKPTDVFCGEIQDYRGDVYKVTVHESTALYDVGRWLGETVKQTNRLSVDYLGNKYARLVDTRTRYIQRERGTGKAVLSRDTTRGIEVALTA